MIEARGLIREFRIPQTAPGLGGKLRRLFAPQYQTIRAVDGVDLQIEEGEIIGLLGPNGAGKSTFIKMLTGVLRPTSGSLSVGGLVPHRDRRRNAYQVGVVYGQRSQLWWDLPLVDSFEILGAMYRVPREVYRKRLDFLIDLLELTEFLQQPVRRLSLGQRMRGEIAASLLHEPPILYLDEPTIGLDVLARNRLLEHIGQLNRERRTTVILTTHNLADVERACPRIVIIDKGRLVLDAPQAQIHADFARKRLLIVEFQREAPEPGPLPEGQVVRREQNKLWIEFDRTRISAYHLAGLVGEGHDVADISIVEEDIESIVTRIYEGRQG